MKIMALTLSLLLSFGLLADVSENLNNLRIINRLSSLETSSKEGTLELASSKSEYTLEIERFINGNIALSQNPWEKAPFKIGINLRSGLAVIAKTSLKKKSEAFAFETQNFLIPLTKDGVRKIKINDSYSYIFDAVMSASLGAYGIDASVGISGGWRFKVLKTKENEVEVHMSLVDGKNATLTYSQGYASLYEMLGADLEKGYHFVIDLNQPSGIEAYEQIIRGNIIFAQEQANFRKGVRYISEKRMQTYYSELGLKIKTPNIAWFMLKNSKRSSISSSKEQFKEERAQTDSLTASYTETSQLDFATFYHGKNRVFSVSKNVTEDSVVAKDIWDEEYNAGNFLKPLILNFTQTTLFSEYRNIHIPETDSNSYSGLHFELRYSQKLLEHLISGDVDYNALEQAAVQALNNHIEEKKKTNPSEWRYSLIDEQRAELLKISSSISLLKKRTLEMRELKNGDPEALLKHYTKIMKVVYKSPYMYKAWTNYTKRCGQTLDLKITSSAFKTYLVHKEFKANQLCTTE